MSAGTITFYMEPTKLGVINDIPLSPLNGAATYRRHGIITDQKEHRFRPS